MSLSFTVKQVTHYSERYPYTHRIEFLDPDNVHEHMRKWCDDTGVPAIIMSSRIINVTESGVAQGAIVYLNEQDVPLFLMRWS